LSKASEFDKCKPVDC